MKDLGQKDNCYPCAPCSPSSEPKIHYPTLYFTVDEKMKCPNEGVATIKFRKVESAENERDPDDPKYRYELEIQGIDIKGGGSEEPDMDFGRGLKKGIREKLARDDEGEDD